MEIADKIIKLLRDNAVDYQEFDHQPIYSSQESSVASDYSVDQAAKCLLLKASHDFILVVLPGSKKLDSKKLKKLLKIKDLRFASPADVTSTMGCVIGACFPFGSLVGLETYVDRGFLKLANMYFNPGLHDKTIKIKADDYLKLEKPILANISII